MEGQCTRTDRQQCMPCNPCHAGHVASAGPGGAWKIFSAINKKPGGGQGHSSACQAQCTRVSHMHMQCACKFGYIIVCMHATYTVGMLKYNHQHHQQPHDLETWRVLAYAGAVFPEAAVWILDKKALMDQASR